MAAPVLLIPVLLGAVPSGDAGLALLRRAREAERAGDTATAESLARQALRRAGGDPKASLAVHREAQDILLAAGKAHDLVKHYDRLLRENVSDPVRRYLRARVETDPTRRRREIQAVLLSSGGLFWAEYDLAEACAREGDWRRAVEHAERAVELAPEEAPAWNVLGHLRLESSRHLERPAERRSLAGKAREAIERALSLDPQLAQAHYNLGLVEFVLGEKERARASWERAVKVEPGFAEALNALGHLAAREGNGDEAILLYTRAIAARPGYGSAHNNLAVVYYRKKEYARALKHTALAEAAGYAVAPSFKRVLVRAREEKAFVDFQKPLARARRRTITVRKAGDAEPLRFSDLEHQTLVMGLLKARFRDSHGGLSIAPADSRTGGERGAGDTVVARYVEAASLEVKLDTEEPRRLVAVAREAAASGKRKLVRWIADAGRRFGAEAPEFTATLAPKLGLELADEK